MGGRLNDGAEVRTNRRDSESASKGGFEPGSVQKFLSTRAAVCNQFNNQRHLISQYMMKEFRSEAITSWWEIVTA